MSNPFVAEIRIFGGNFAPRGWATCDGQIMAISQNTALFSLLGTNYGGNGTSNFGLPNLAGSAPMHPTQYGGGSPFGDFFLGQTGGTSSVTLLQSEIPAHTHAVQAQNDAGTTGAPGGDVLSTLGRRGKPLYGPTSATAAMHPQAVGVAGGNQPHNNLQPYLGILFIIALQGVFPPRP